MKYCTLIKEDGTTCMISIELSGWLQPYQKLFDQTDVSGYDRYICHRFNNFNNDFTKEDEKLYKEYGYFAEIFHDIVEHREPDMGEDQPGENFVPVIYIAHAGLPNEFRKKGWFPEDGIYVPDGYNEDGTPKIFIKETLIPVKVISYDQYETAQKIYAEHNIPTDQLSFFCRARDYKNNTRFVGRVSVPNDSRNGVFDVDMDKPPDMTCFDRIASRPKVEDHIETIKIDLTQKLI